MRLILENKASADPVVGVRWCLGPADFTYLEGKRDLKELTVLLLVKYSDQTEDRILVPADEIMTYVSFRRPGTHTIHAVLLSLSDDGRKLLTKKISCRQYYYNLLATDGQIDSVQTMYLSGVRSYFTAQSVEVVVPEEYFPKTPPKWLSKLADLGFSFPASDQCQMRRRYFGVPFKLAGLGVWFFVTIFLRLVVSVLVWTSTAPRVSFKPIFHPWKMDIADITAKCPKDWLFDCRLFRGKDGKDTSLFRLFLHPWLWMLIFFIMTMIKLGTHSTYLRMIKSTIHGAVVFFSHAWLGIVLAAILITTAYLIHQRINSESWLEAYRLRQAAKNAKRNEETRNLLECRIGLHADVSEIPVSKRSIRLIYLDIKRRVCRPFAR